MPIVNNKLMLDIEKIKEHPRLEHIPKLIEEFSRVLEDSIEFRKLYEEQYRLTDAIATKAAEYAKEIDHLKNENKILRSSK